MINQKEDIINFISKTVFIVFFFFLISAFSKQSDYHSDDISQCKVIYESLSNPVKAINVSEIPLPSLQKSVSILDNTNSVFYNENFKIFSYSNRITQRIILLQNIRQSFKPIIICGFYCPRFSTEDDEVPILS
jgi:hypothetical protein